MNFQELQILNLIKSAKDFDTLDEIEAVYYDTIQLNPALSEEFYRKHDIIVHGGVIHG